MRRVVLALLLALGLGFGPVQPARAQGQDFATLVADRVELRGAVLVASGNVEVFSGSQRLSAARVTYDGDGGGLRIDGPLVLTDAQGGTTLYADAAELSDDLRAGILRSARLVLEDRLQIAATEIERLDGRFTRLNNTVASTCKVCAARPVPLWQIRAAEVIQDEVAQQIYFRNARFEIAGVPVLWLPRLRFPGPGLDRATGFLAPQIRSTDTLGLGIKLPYFFRLGDHADLTLTPYLSAARTRTLEGRYRHAFRTGTFEARGAVTSDDIRPDEVRSYLFAEGAFRLPRGYDLRFDVESASDAGYLLDYDYSDKDRLDSAVEVSRYGGGGFTFAGLTAYRSLRDRESNETQPTIVADAGIERRFSPQMLGGTAAARLLAHGHYRRSDLDVDGPDADSAVDGRDVLRIEAAVDWHRDWVVGPGLLVGAQTALNLNHTMIDQDAGFAEPVSRAWGAAAVTLRWPLLRRVAGGGRFLLEPIAQFAWAEATGDAGPRDESTLLEFDEGNLTALDRFPAGDAFETGPRANIGVRMVRDGGAGYRWDLTLARIWRQEDHGQFTGAPSLDRDRSDWLAALTLDMPGRLQLQNRTLYDEELGFESNSLRLGWTAQDLALSGTFLWLRENADQDRLSDVRELSLDAEYQIDTNWAASLDYRFDFEQNRTASAELGLAYQNDCVAVDLSLSRRFTSSTSVTPTTDFGLEVRLTGFGGTARGTPPGACRG